MPQRTTKTQFNCTLDRGESLKVFKPKCRSFTSNLPHYEFQVNGVKLGLIWRTPEGKYAAEWGRRDHPTPESAIAELKRIVTNNKERHASSRYPSPK